MKKTVHKKWGFFFTAFPPMSGTVFFSELKCLDSSPSLPLICCSQGFGYGFLASSVTKSPVLKKASPYKQAFRENHPFLPVFFVILPVFFVILPVFL